MSQPKGQFFTARNIAVLAILTAFVLILQCSLGSVAFANGTSFALTLVPIAIGAILLGPIGGAILGGIFGIIVLVYGVTGVDPFTLALFQYNPVLTSVICLGKGIAAGLVPGIIFRALGKKHPRAGVIVAVMSAPVVNTGLFLIGAFFLLKPISDFLGGASAIHFLLYNIIVLNFLLEFAVNAVASPAVYAIIKATEKSLA